MIDIKNAHRAWTIIKENYDSVNVFNRNKGSSNNLIYNYLEKNQISDDVKNIIIEAGLDKPENMIKFLLELHFASFDSIYDGINDIRKDLYIKVASKVESAKNKIEFANNNPNLKADSLKEARYQLSDCLAELRKLITDSYTEKLKKIDDRKNLFVKLLYSKSDNKNAVNNVIWATGSMKLYFEALNLLSVISVNESSNVFNYFSGAESFIKQLERESKISLIAAYEEKGENQYWDIDKIKKQLENITNNHMDLKSFIDDSKETEVDFEDLF